MDYKDILNKQGNKLRRDLNWWPSFLYHFTDVHNASSILDQGWIYSREQVEKQNIMRHDNASRAVIDATNVESKSYGRLYFRPLTPTQFHNEGYKPEEVREKEINASCPVPIFLCLTASDILEYEGTKFAERGISGKRNDVQTGIEAFSELNFDKIYHEGPLRPEEKDIIEYRHSEVIHEGGFPVNPFLRCILCRTQAERETLLYLLQRYSLRLYNTYKDKVLYKPTLKCFYNNGIFLKYVSVKEGKLYIEFNDPEQRIKVYQNEIELEINIELLYKKFDGRILKYDNVAGIINYCKSRSGEVILRKNLDYDILGIKVKIDQAVMYENEIIVGDELF